MRATVAVLGALVLAGCNPDNQPGGDSRAKTIFEPDLPADVCAGEFYEITVVDNECTIDSFRYSAEVTGWTGHAILNLWEVVPGGTGGRNEEHTLLSYEFDPTCAWDHLERGLTQGAAELFYVSDENTQFLCDPDDVGRPDDRDALTYALRVYDTNLQWADCVIWGANVEQVLLDPGGIGLGDVPGANPITNASEITGCRIFE